MYGIPAGPAGLSPEATRDPKARMILAYDPADVAAGSSPEDVDREAEALLVATERICAKRLKEIVQARRERRSSLEAGLTPDAIAAIGGPGEVWVSIARALQVLRKRMQVPAGPAPDTLETAVGKVRRRTSALLAIASADDCTAGSKAAMSRMRACFAEARGRSPTLSDNRRQNRLMAEFVYAWMLAVIRAGFESAEASKKGPTD